MNSIVITTLIKDGEKFLPLESVTRTFSEEEYMEGALIIKTGNQIFMGEDFWDIVLLMWALILPGFLKMLSTGTEMKICFPDQPIDFSIQEPRTNTLKLQLDYDSEHREVLVAKNDFIRALRTAAQEFTDWLRNGAEKEGLVWPELQGYIDKLKEFE